MTEPVHALRLDGDANSMPVLVLVEAVLKQAVEERLQTLVHLGVIATDADVVVDGMHCRTTR